MYALYIVGIYIFIYVYRYNVLVIYVIYNCENVCVIHTYFIYEFAY